jgi:hypothetical protein
MLPCRYGSRWFGYSRENCWPFGRQKANNGFSKANISGKRAMAGKSLTDFAIRKAKPAARLVKLSDGGGLQLWVTPAGGKLWYYAYRFDGRQKKLAIGSYGAAPGVSLEAARARRDEAKALLRQGVDPAAHKRRLAAVRAETAANTFEAIADELVARKIREAARAGGCKDQPTELEEGRNSPSTSGKALQRSRRVSGQPYCCTSRREGRVSLSFQRRADPLSEGPVIAHRRPLMSLLGPQHS